MRNRYVHIVLALAALALTATVISGCGSAKKGSTADGADRAFVQQMNPHHMMAVQIAQTAEQKASHSQIKTLAVGIVTAQDAEIAEMKPIAKTLGVIPAATPSGGQMGSQMMSDAQTHGIQANQMGMSMT